MSPRDARGQKAMGIVPPKVLIRIGTPFKKKFEAFGVLKTEVLVQLGFTVYVRVWVTTVIEVLFEFFVFTHGLLYKLSAF
jgi:hypothetical protein